MMNPKLAAAYGAHRMAKGGAMKCAHGGPMKCAIGCYAKGGMIDDDEDNGSVDEDANVEYMARGGMARPGLAKKIMAKKMAHGGLLSDDYDENDDSEEPMAMQAQKDYAFDDLEDPLYAEGGEIMSGDDIREEPQTMIEHIMDRMKKKAMRR